jgi:predicted amidophosphoribosyltransferase
MLLIAKQLGRQRRLPVRSHLERATTTKQRSASRSLRITQAKAAFQARGSLDPELIYLLLDDVVTTGATMKYAAKTLQAAGAQNIWVAAISRQPLD